MHAAMNVETFSRDYSWKPSLRGRTAMKYLQNVAAVAPMGRIDCLIDVRDFEPANDFFRLPGPLVFVHDVHCSAALV